MNQTEQYITVFDAWEANFMGGFSSFENGLFRLYQISDTRNKEKLRSVFPTFLENKTILNPQYKK